MRRRRLRSRPLAAAFALLAILICVIGLAVARLAAGPVDLTWLVPFVESTLSKHTDAVTVQLGNASIDWPDWSEGPTLSLGDVHAATSDDAFDIRIDALSGALSVTSLLAGQPVPSRLSARGVTATVLLPTAPEEAAADRGETPPLTELIDTGPVRFIDAISIDDASVAFARAPGEVSWQGRIVNMAIVRGANGLEGDASVTLDQQGAPGKATLAVRSDATTKITTAALLFNGVRLAALAPLSHPWPPFRRSTCRCRETPPQPSAPTVRCSRWH